MTSDIYILMLIVTYLIADGVASVLWPAPKGRR